MRRIVSVFLIGMPALLDAQIVGTVQTISTNPDLVPRTLQVPSQAKPGETATMSLTVYNGGKASAKGGWTGRVYMSKDASVDKTDMLVGTFTYGSSIGMSLAGTASGSVTIPSTLLPAVYYLAVLVDATDIITESSETNNLSAASRITVADADLVAASVSRATAEISTNSTVSVVPKNGAAGTIPAGWTGRIYLSQDADISASDILIGSFTYSSPIGAGATGALTQVNVSLPAGTAEGTYNVGVIMDATNAVVETSESNNTMLGGTIAVRYFPHLVATLPTTQLIGASGVKSGQSIELSLSVKNDGTAPANGFSTNLYLSEDNEFLPVALDCGLSPPPGCEDVVIGTLSDTRSIPVGGTISVSKFIQIPANKTPATYYVGSRIEQTFQGFSKPLTVVAPPDIKALSIRVTGAAVRGQPLPLITTVSNVGTGSAKPTWKIHLQSTLGVSDVLVDTEIPSGQSKEIGGTLNVPPSIDPGVYEIVVAAADLPFEQSPDGFNATNVAKTTVPVPAIVGFKLDSLRSVSDANGNKIGEAVLSHIGDHLAAGDGWSSVWRLEVLYGPDSLAVANGSRTSESSGFVSVPMDPPFVRPHESVRVSATPPLSAEPVWMSLRMVNISKDNVVMIPSQGLGYAIRHPRQ